MVKIRLARVGRHKRPFYRIVATDSCSARNGQQIEILGTHDPFSKKTTLDQPMISKWLKVGAITTPTVKVILKKAWLNEKESEESKVEGTG
jgi:small subunit ribosomal protein S16